MCAVDISELEAKVQTAKERIEEVQELLLKFAKCLDSMPPSDYAEGALCGRLKTQFDSSIPVPKGK
ncbi:hypothetical protein fHeYen901_31 [Yersinia phage fHe-Yen9-01]|uniref:Uncharacterized protein n=1 Tax=Yersinia phage fHe-Yen9-01 TaxID=1965363 RepID=A0A1V0DXB9_9CAUD|nr:hypothetical protein KNT60_gp030 [Yersinia phage fHe-Yen9-01]ARB05804.1 hypothetical protein fHeYen901_31 [Yersinia phage fHe-Yen9-01]